MNKVDIFLNVKYKKKKIKKSFLNMLAFYKQLLIHSENIKIIYNVYNVYYLFLMFLPNIPDNIPDTSNIQKTFWK